MPSKYQQVAGTTANDAGEKAKLVELTPFKVPADAPTAPRADNLVAQNTILATVNSNSTPPFQNVFTNAMSAREECHHLEQQLSALVTQYSALPHHHINAAPGHNLTARIREVQDRIAVLQLHIPRSQDQTTTRQSSASAAQRINTPTSATFNTMVSRALDSPGARLSAAAPEFTPSTTAAKTTPAPVVVSNTGGGGATITRKKSNIDLHAVSQNAERRHSREFSDNTNIGGSSSGTGTTQSQGGQIGGQAGGGKDNFEYQVPPGVIVPTVSVTDASPNNYTPTSALQYMHRPRPQRNDKAQSMSQQTQQTQQMFSQNVAHNDAAQQQLRQRENQHPAQQQLFELAYAPGVSYTVNLPGTGPMNYDAVQDVAPPMYQQAPPVYATPPMNPMTMQPQPAQHPIYANYQQQFPLLGQAQQAHAQAVHQAQAQKYQQAQMQAQQAQMQQGQSAIYGQNARDDAFQDPMMYQVNTAAAGHHQFGGHAQMQHQQHGNNPLNNYANPIYAGQHQQAQQDVQPPPGFQQQSRGVHGVQSGGSLIAQFQGGGSSGQYGPAVAAAQGQVLGQQAHAHPQGQARVPSNVSQASSGVSKPVCVKTATTTAAAKTTGGLWFPPGKDPADLKKNSGSGWKNGKPKSKGGMGTPFNTPAKEDKGKPASPSWIQSDYELTGKWSTLPDSERTPPSSLRLARLADNKPTAEELYEHHIAYATDNSLADTGPFGGSGGGGQGGLSYGQTGVQQYNSFGAPIGDGGGLIGAQAQRDIHEGDPNHMSRPEMEKLVEYFDHLMAPPRQHKTWGNEDGGDDDENDENDEDEDDDDDDPGQRTPKATIIQLANPNPRQPSLQQQKFERKHKPAPLDMARIPLAQQLGLTTPTTNSQPILPSAHPTRHVSHGVTNILDRVSGNRNLSVIQPGSQPSSAGLGSTFNLPQGTVIPHIWKSDNQAVRDNFKYVASQAHHLGFSESPAFPETVAQFASVRADQKNRAADLLSKQIHEKEALLTDGGRAKKTLLEVANAAANDWASRTHSQIQSHQIKGEGLAANFREETQRKANELFSSMMKAQNISVPGDGHAAKPQIRPSQYYKYHLTASARPSRYFPKLLDKYAYEAPPGMIQNGGPNMNAQCDAMNVLAKITGAGPDGRPMKLLEVSILKNGVANTFPALKPVPGPVATVFGSQFKEDLGSSRFKSLYALGQPGGDWEDASSTASSVTVYDHEIPDAQL